MSAAKVKVLKGWRRLRRGTVVLKGDKYMGFDGEWRKSTSDGIAIGEPGTRDLFKPRGTTLIYIRRIPRKRRARK